MLEKLRPAARVPAKPSGEDGILNQNPIFEIGSHVTVFCRHLAALDINGKIGAKQRT
jgi:hypothetical protein